MPPTESIPNGWISAKQFAQIAGLSETGARKVLRQMGAGKAWRGGIVQVRLVAGATGRGGRAWQVHAASLKAAMGSIVSMPAAQVGALIPLEATPSHLHGIANALRFAEMLAPAAAFPKKSAARSAVLQELSRSEGIPLRTLRRAVQRLEEGGAANLARRGRSDKGRPRVLVTRRWDSKAPLPDEAKKQIADAMAHHVKGLYQKIGEGGVRNIMQLGAAALVELSRSAGWEDCTLSDCALSEAFCRRYSANKIIHIKRENAKEFVNKLTPRIARDIGSLRPLEWVVGDVHPMDTPLHRGDGSMVYPRMIAWMDVATQDMYIDVVVLPKNRAIRQEDVVRSFVNLCMEWGIPERLYLDNGTEFKGALEKFDGLTATLERNNRRFLAEDWAIVRARPYNASAKPIENAFGLFERRFGVLMEGFVGGDRLNPRTRTVGKRPMGFNRTREEYLDELKTVIEYFRNTGNPSPNDRWRSHLANGWKPYKATFETLVVGLGTEARPKVQTGGIQVNGRWYRDEEIHSTPGQRVTVKYSKWHVDHVVLIAGGSPRAIPLRNVHAFGDVAGAQESSRLIAAQKRHIKSLEVDDSHIDPIREAERFNAMNQTPPRVGTSLQSRELLVDAEIRANAGALASARHPEPVYLKRWDVVSNETGRVLNIGPTVEPPISTDLPDPFDPIGIGKAKSA